MATIASASITAQNTFTTPKQINGWFNVGISGTFVATVTAQRSIDNATWFDVDTWTIPQEDVGLEPEFMWYRIGVKTGNFTSGTVVVRFGQETGFHV